MNNPWENIFGWFTYSFYYEHIVKISNSNSKFVEVGSFMGRSTCCMAHYIKESGKDIEFFAVDHWKGSEEHLEHFSDIDLFLTFEKHLKDKDLYQYVKPIKMDSLEASKLFDDESIDFVHLDASHDYESCISDIKSWYPKVKKGGIISGDDFNLCHFPGVVKAVYECFCGKPVYLLNKPQEIGCIWSLEKDE